MTELLRVPIGDDDEGSLVVETTPDPRDVQQVSRVGDRVIQATQSLEEALQPISRAASKALQALRATDSTSVQVEFGVRIHAKTGVVLTEAGAEGHLKVTITWDRASAEPMSHGSRSGNAE
ncbi:CU044_2847 family protein [Streptomyces avicenniae]|uniref:CU044_2847 family protein n=1 Tax=Streptomyces avicenniae TaxID=500153 RepID=UPI00069BBF84|nr:CU044_2847 family protein [Streptomyces avicenniae]